jgi:hypothetical protein
MKRSSYLKTMCAVAIACAHVSPASADCSVKSLAGRWMFATGVGRQSAMPDRGDVSAIGIFSLDRAGKLTGKFDANMLNGAPLVGVKFDGTITVNPDCTGELNFSTAMGDKRTDSIVVINSREIAGMRRDAQFVWTYQMRRL